jgi:antimicrobial peptide system SdpB family protein
MLTRLGYAAQRWSTTTPWTNVYGVARSLLALATAGTLAFSATGSLFRPAAGLPQAPYCNGPGRMSLFCLVPHDQLWLARWLAVAILLVVASGWRPRYTALFHWWVSFSFAVSATIPDGGDQATAVLTLLMLPVALTDPRRWHWQTLPEEAATATRHALRLIALSALLVIRVQVAGIYLNSSIAKLAVTEWRDGTAVYYWIGQPVFGAPGWLRGILLAMAATTLGVIAMTWGTLILEFALGIAIVMPRRAGKYLLPAGILFHAGIALMMGLLSFSIAMAAALILYLRPVDQPFRLGARFSLPRLRGSVREGVSTSPSLQPAPLASRSASR